MTRADGWRVRGKLGMWVSWMGAWVDERLVLRCPERGWGPNPAQSPGPGEKQWCDRHLGAESARPGRAEGQGGVPRDVQVSSLEAWDDPGIIRDEWSRGEGDESFLDLGA